MFGIFSESIAVGGNIYGISLTEAAYKQNNLTY